MERKENLVSASQTSNGIEVWKSKSGFVETNERYTSAVRMCIQSMTSDQSDTLTQGLNLSFSFFN